MSIPLDSSLDTDNKMKEKATKGRSAAVYDVYFSSSPLLYKCPYQCVSQCPLVMSDTVLIREDSGHSSGGQSQDETIHIDNSPIQLCRV